MAEPAEPYLVVGLGASAGGIAVLKEFFRHLPATTGNAYVVILHLSPEHESLLSEILQTVATIPVAQVTERVKLQPDHAYVIAPNKSLSVDDGHLNVSDAIGFEARRAPVDIFFRALANAKDAHAVCVVLSGTGPNGSMGLKRVKERGGIVIAQDPAEAEFDDMPRNAMATGLVDYVLPVREIPTKIQSYQGRLQRLPRPEQSDERPGDEQIVRAILAAVRAQTGHDFVQYKRGTILRRMQRRLSVHELPDLLAYREYVSQHPKEAFALLRDLLISVTHFFRDRDAWAALEATVIPRLLEGRRPDDVIRVWVAGCATGEEAYSMAMALSDAIATHKAGPRFQIFATDIDADAIAAARAGLYTNSDVADVPPDRLRRFFVREGEDYRVRRELRDGILFTVHNILRDPPFSMVDLVSCRNLLIYLNRMDLSRIGRGQIELQKEHIEIADVVARAIETVDPLLKEHLHRLILLVPEAGLRVKADPSRMAQVISNLLTNAAKYSERGSEITVRAVRDDGRLRLSVEDQGLGIAPDMVSHTTPATC